MFHETDSFRLQNRTQSSMQNGEDCVTLNGRLIQLTPTNTPNYQIHSSNKSITDQIIQLHLILASASAPSPIYLCSTCVFAVHVSLQYMCLCRHVSLQYMCLCRHVSLQYMCLCSTCVFAVEVSLLTEFWTRGYGTWLHNAYVCVCVCVVLGVSS